MNDWVCTAKFPFLCTSLGKADRERFLLAHEDDQALLPTTHPPILLMLSKGKANVEPAAHQ